MELTCPSGTPSRRPFGAGTIPFMRFADLDDSLTALAQTAARLVVEEGLEYAAAKRKAGQQMGWPARGPWPDNALMDVAVREHIALFCPEEQARDLQWLRAVALTWMERLAAFDPYVGGAVWQGTATRHSDIYLQLFCDEPKAVEWFLLDQRVSYHPGSAPGWRGEAVPVLTVRPWCEGLQQWLLVHLMLHDARDLRGALRPDAQGRAPRGDAKALRQRMDPGGDAVIAAGLR